MNYKEKILELNERYNSIPKQRRFFLLCFFSVAVFVTFSLFMISPPRDFPLGQVVNIEPGASMRSISHSLSDSKVIRSPFVFRLSVAVLGGEKKLIAGDYLLDKKEGPIDLAYRITQGKFHLDTFKATIPEGWNIFQIGDYLKNNLKNFDRNKFISLAKNKEGYLFPDTYFISPYIKPEKIIDIMSKNFETKIKTVSGISTSTYLLKDVVTMASILEEEARTTESRRIVAGILWQRLSMGMPLQVDSTFLYINGKNTYELTLDDLKINSPYNTYIYRGLPPGPISNPGTDAIYAAINPIKTKYLYFLSSKSGKMYYATTFEQHKRNKELYLNK